MSLDVYLIQPGAVTPPGTGIYVRENGSTRELTREEWDERFPGREPLVMASDDDAGSSSGEVYHRNITNNLVDMAKEAGLHIPMWRPDELGITNAGQLVPMLRAGLAALRADPERFAPLNPSNGWGSYDGLVKFVADYLAACERWPMAMVRVSR